MCRQYRVEGKDPRRKGKKSKKDVVWFQQALKCRWVSMCRQDRSRERTWCVEYNLKGDLSKWTYEEEGALDLSKITGGS